MIEKIIELVKGKKVVILMHNNADADAVGSAIALKEELLGKICPGVEIVAPQCMTKGASKLASGLGAEVKACSESAYFPLKGFEASVVVDSLSPEQLVPYRLPDLPRPMIVIDHHYEREEFKREAAVYISEDKPSCAEVILGLLRDFGVADVSEKSRLAILAAVIADTQHLSRARVATIRDILSLAPSDADLERARELISIQPDLSEKIACLKAMRSVEFERLPVAGGTVLLAWCIAGSFESTVANVLIKGGADIAVVAAEKEGRNKNGGDFVRISGRSRHKGIHMGKDVFEPMGRKFGGSGGGHAAAASVNINAPLREGLKSCTNLIKKLVNPSN